MNNSTLNRLYNRMHDAVVAGQWDEASASYLELSHKAAMLDSYDQDKVVWRSIQYTYQQAINNRDNRAFSE